MQSCIYAENNDPYHQHGYQYDSRIFESRLWCRPSDLLDLDEDFTEVVTDTLKDIGLFVFSRLLL